MAGTYDGSIRINTLINTAPLDNGLGSIESKIKDIASTIGLAFGVKELIDFGKSAVGAASDLAEAQNVVDTAFGQMSYKMEQFADIAMETYGISELTAKNMGSTYMAMAKGMGVATDAASDMAVTLTGRLSDIMSFYNKTQSEVDTIGRAMITGETEPLKAIGVVMTQTNLEAYAMAQGLNKAYTEMSAQEQLLVRYKYFLEQTALAEGDFAKTSESWANQTRLLSERFSEFNTNLGEVLIKIFTPAIQFANEAVSFLNDLFFGGDESDTTAAKNAAAVADEVTAVGTEAEKSEKKLNSLLSGFDELHIISGAKTEEDSNTDAGIDTSDLLGVNLEADTRTAKKAAEKYRDIINEIYLAFKRHPLTKVIEGIIDSIGKFFGIFDVNDIDAGDVVTKLMDILGAILLYTAISDAVVGISNFSTGFGKLIKLITANPVAAAVVGIIALAAGIYALSEEMERQRVADCFGDISISLEEIHELTDPITKDIDNVADAFADNKAKLKTAKENFLDISEAVEKTFKAFENGSSDNSVEDFSKQLDEFIDSALGVNSAVMDTSALEQLYAADGIIDESEQEILDKFSEIGDSVAGRIELIREQIHSITQTAIDENRSLLESELQNIQDLYNQIAEMTSMQKDIEEQATWERLKNGAYSYDSYAELASAIKEAEEQAKKSRDEVEKSGYEQLISQITYGLNSGEIDPNEAEILKAEGIAKINENLQAMELKSKRYERDVILAFAEGAVTDFAKAYSHDPEDIAKMQQYFKMQISAPEGVNAADFFPAFAMSSKDVQMYNYIANISDEMKKHLGFDFASEWERLNDEIGDSVFTLDDFYKSLEDVLQNTEGIDVDDILPSLEEFKGRPDEYSKILMDWISYADYSIQLGLELDPTDVEEILSQFSPDKYNAQGFGSGNPTQTNAEQQTGETKLDIRLFMNEEEIDRDKVILRPDWTQNFNKTIVSNGKGG